MRCSRTCSDSRTYQLRDKRSSWFYKSNKSNCISFGGRESRQSHTTGLSLPGLDVPDVLPVAFAVVPTGLPEVASMMLLSDVGRYRCVRRRLIKHEETLAAEA